MDHKIIALIQSMSSGTGDGVVNPPTATLVTVNGKSGSNISLTTTDIPEGTNKYYTDAKVSANTDVANTKAHTTNTSNPHGVTKAQVGLGNVQNVDTTNATNITTGTLPSGQVPIATSSNVGGIKVGNGLGVDGTGLTTAKLGTGLKLDGANNIITDNANIDISTLKNANTLVLGSFKGTFTATDSLSKFSNGTKGDFWLYNGANGGTLGGLTFKAGDQLWVNTSYTNGTPANLTTYHSQVPNTMSDATATTGGLVPVPPNNALKFFNGQAQFVSLPTLSGASATVNGTSGLPVAPSMGQQNNYLKGDGTWSAINTMTGATSSVNGSNGLVPAPTTTDRDKFLKGDGTWAIASLSNGTVSTNANITLSVNNCYDVTSVSANGATLTLPSGTTQNDRIKIIVSCTGFNDSTTFNITGIINGGTNTVVNNRSFVCYEFTWSSVNSSWVLGVNGQGF